MTIKEFSKLCKCNPQTLRYYDHIDLLKPASVDDFTEYRYYEERQAVDFVRIKNLQKAGFSIDEIRGLLEKSDDVIYLAFESKIREQEEKLHEIRRLQQAYQSDVIVMKNRIEEFRKTLKKSRETFNPCEEFGIDREEYLEILNTVDELIGKIIENGNFSSFDYDDYADKKEAEEEYFNSCLSGPDSEIVFERHGWNFFKEVLPDLPELSEKYGYYFLYKLIPDKKDSTAFASTAVGLMLRREETTPNLGCTVIDSDDYQNHFWIVRYNLSDTVG